MIGTFYRTSNPDADPFVSVGDSISAGQTVCIIEAMKLLMKLNPRFPEKLSKFWWTMPHRLNMTSRFSLLILRDDFVH
jgi:hypothetical protein